MIPNKVPKLDLLSAKFEEWGNISDPVKRSKAVTEFYMAKILEPTYYGSNGVLTDGANDGGLDAYLEIDAEKKIILVQCVWLDQGGSSLSKKDGRKLLHFYEDYLSKNEIAGLKEDVAQFVRKYNSILKGYELEFRYVTNGVVQKADASAYPAALQVIGPTMLDIELYCAFAEVEPVKNTIEFRLDDKKYFEWTIRTDPNQKVNVLQCMVSGLDLAQAYRIHKDKLLMRNLRFLLGGKINERIYETAEKPEESSKFYLYHNGISVTCDKYEFVNREEGVAVKLTNAQIVNGGQSTATLSKIPDAILDTIRLPCKISQTTDTGLEQSIAESNNTQNSIKPLDLIANSDSLVFLQNFAAGMITPPIFLKRKSGKEDWKNVKMGEGLKKPPSLRTIHYKDAAQGFFAFSGHPVKAYGAPTPYITPNSNGIYLSMVRYPDPKLMIAAGLLTKYENEVDTVVPKFTKYWSTWAVAAFGHIYNYEMTNNKTKKQALSKILSEKGPETWKHPIRGELIKLFEEIFPKYYPKLQFGEDYLMQGFFKGQQEVFDIDKVRGIAPTDILSYIGVGKSDLKLSELKNAQKISFTRYDVDFAVFAAAMHKELAADSSILNRIIASF